MYHWLRNPQLLILTPLTLMLLFALACGGTAAEPVIVEKEVPKEVIVEKEVVKEVPKEVIVEKEVVKEVVKEVIVIATPAPAPAKAMEREAWVDIGASKHYQGVFPLISSSNPGFWDLHYGGSSNTTLTPSAPRFSLLVEYNPVDTDAVIGDLAKIWEVNAAGDEYTFQLHDANWQDGKPVTADDIKFSLDRIVMPDALRGKVGWLKGVYDHNAAVVIDEKTIKVPLKFATNTFIPSMASGYMAMYPRHVVENLSQDDMNCCPEKYFGSGPWKLKGWEKDGFQEYERNDSYFKNPRPFFDGLKVFIVRDAARRLAAWQTEQAYAHYHPWTGANAPWDMLQLEKDTDGRMRASIMEGVGLQTLFLNFTKPPFDNPDIRRAFFIGIDRPAGMETAYRGFASPGTFFYPGFVEDPTEFISNNLPGYRVNKEEDLAEAKKLITDAGYELPLKLTINSPNRGSSLRGTEAVVAQLRQNGIADITIDGVPLASFYVKLRDGSHPLSLIGTGIVTKDPGGILSEVFAQGVLRNPHNWSDPRVDALMAEQDKEQDPVRRTALVKEIADILHEGHSHVTPLWWNSVGATFDYRIRNWHKPNTVQLIHKWDQAWWDPDAKKPDKPGYWP